MPTWSNSAWQTSISTPVSSTFARGRATKIGEVLFPTSFRGALAQYFERQRLEGVTSLFASNRDRPSSTRRIRQIVTHDGRAASIEKRVYPHLFRHQLITYLTKQGIISPKLQLLSGHTLEQSKHGHDRLCWLSQKSRKSGLIYSVRRPKRPSTFLWLNALPWLWRSTAATYPTESRHPFRLRRWGIAPALLNPSSGRRLRWAMRPKFSTYKTRIWAMMRQNFRISSPNRKFNPHLDQGC